MRTRIVHAPAVVLYSAKAEVGHKVNVKALASAIVKCDQDSMVVAHPQDTEWVIVGMGGRARKRAHACCKFAQKLLRNQKAS